MPARKDGRIEKGQKLSTAISARAYNRAQQAADIVLGVTPELGVQIGRGANRAYEWAYCRASVSVDLWGILEITGLENTPQSTADDPSTRSFQDTPVLTGGTPSSSTRAWCVAVEPISSGSIGRVAVAGVVQCKASIGDSSHKYVRAKSSTAELESATSGEGLILWKGNGWALVRIGTVDLTKYSGFSANAQQVLAHNASGQIVWLNTTSC